MRFYWNQMFGLGFAASKWWCLDDDNHTRSRMCLEFRFFILNLMICGTLPIGKWRKHNGR